MTKQVKLSDASHARLSLLAKESYRNIGQQIDFMLDQMDKPGDSTARYLGAAPLPGQTSVDDLIIDGNFDSTEKVRTEIAEKNRFATRDKGDVLDDIRSAEAERDEALAYNQDDESRRKMRVPFDAQIAELWAEYRELDA